MLLLVAHLVCVWSSVCPQCVAEGVQKAKINGALFLTESIWRLQRSELIGNAGQSDCLLLLLRKRGKLYLFFYF